MISLQLLLGLVDAGDVGEADVDVLLHVDLGLAAPDGHEAVVAGLTRASNHEHPERADDRDRDDPTGGVAPEVRLHDAVDLDAVFGESSISSGILDADGLERVAVA